MVELSKVTLINTLWFLVAIASMPITAMAGDPVLTATTSAEKAWQRQQIIVTIEVQTDDPFARLQADDFKQSGLSIEALSTPLIIERGALTETKRAEKKSYVLRKKWAVYPLISGNYKLNLPRVRYRPNRGSIKILATPSLPLEVQHLPIYVPPTMPVGKVSLQSTWNNGFIITTKKIVNWQIKVSGEGVVRQTMPRVLRKVVSTKSLDVLPAHTNHEVKTSEQGVEHQLTYSIPLKALQNGRLKLPKLAVQYFDPELGKLKRVQFSTPFVIAFNKILQWIIVLVVLAGLLTGLLVVTQRMKMHLNTFAKKRYALRLLEQASTYQQARSALNLLSKTLGLGDNLTLAEFVAAWKKHYRRDDVSKLDEAMQALNAYEFDRHKAGKVTQVAKILSRIL